MNSKLVKNLKIIQNLVVRRNNRLGNKIGFNIPRIVIIFLITGLFAPMISPIDEIGVASAASFEGDYRVDDTGTGKTIQWVPTIARNATGEILVAWYDNRDGNNQGVYFAKSSDRGKTFGKNVVVNDSATYTHIVRIHNKYMAVDNTGGTYHNNIYVVWEDLRNDIASRVNYDVYFTRSTDGGNSFGTNLKLVDDTINAPQIRPAMTVDNSGNIYAVWTDLRDTKSVTDLNIYFTKSTNGGAGFSANKRVDDGPGTAIAECPAITVNETGVIYVAWHDTRNGNVDIYCTKSENGGTTFSTSKRVTDTSFSTTGRLSYPSIISRGSNVYIVWCDNQSGNWDIRMAYSSDGGLNWSSPVKVNDDSGTAEQYYPDIAIDDNNTLYVVWNDERNGNHDIYSANSTNGGSSFGTNTRVDHDTGSAVQRYASAVGEPGGGITVVWEDWRNDTDGKYIKSGGTDSANNANVYCAFGGAPNFKSQSASGKPPTPENLKVNLVVSGSALDITWDKVNIQNLANYTIYWSMDGNTYGKLVNVSADSAVLRYIHTDLVNGLTYYYKISVSDNNGNESNLSLAVANIPDIDTDMDGVGNENDWDDDGDGIADFQDDFPLDVSRTKDTDRDGLDDDLDDIDDDNDGYTDLAELILGTDPLNPGFKPADFDSDLIPDAFDDDIDNDGVNNTNDDLDYNPYEHSDFDNDNIGDNSDEDDDNDGVIDSQDAFPLNASSWRDTDGDGIGDNYDDDIDGDGVNNDEDAFEYNKNEWRDTDGDGIGDHLDIDIDGDNVINTEDSFPYDSTEWFDTDGDHIGNNADTDDDSDGFLDGSDAFPLNPREWLDTDGDGTGNNADRDDDNDGYPDVVEEICGTNTTDAKSYPADSDLDGTADNIDSDDDNDGIPDDRDAFPKDPAEWLDSDGDGLGDNIETDDDSDGIPDTEDLFPKDSTEWEDTDGDGVGNNLDMDDDNDGVPDDNDAFPRDPSEWEDTDGDGIGDNAETDDDHDGYIDEKDRFPKDRTEWNDFDGDGLGDNFDPDDDNDGVPDDNDAFPKDPTEWYDNDGDSLGDNIDTDDDNDGVDDISDEFMYNPEESNDFDGDEIGDNADPDDDNDGISDDNDAFPLNPEEWFDSDYDGKGNNEDTDDDNDGVLDINDKFPLNPGESGDNDNDDIGDNSDQDDDNDGVIDVHDDFPLDSSRSKQPAGANELWLPMMITLIILIIIIFLLLTTFTKLFKRVKRISPAPDDEKPGKVSGQVDPTISIPPELPLPAPELPKPTSTESSALVPSTEPSQSTQLAQPIQPPQQIPPQPPQPTQPTQPPQSTEPSPPVATPVSSEESAGAEPQVSQSGLLPPTQTQPSSDQIQKKEQ
ncbi:MAG: thrombospondin type 3 repeat-containing protein [Thermoplasmata archaeon]|nr:MAG: thrombospondin type 3 repeat-containing protein [Thermoplasmata archaeon]